MLYLQLFFSRSYWLERLLKLETGTAFLSLLGAFWLILRILTYFRPDLDACLRTHGVAAFWGMVLLGAVGTLFVRRPQVVIKHQVEGRDILIRLVVGDMMRMKGPCVIGTNTTFDTDASIIDSESLQGRYATDYYESVAHLDADISEGLQGRMVVENLACEEGRRGKTERYELGTVVPVNRRGRRVYWLPIADMSASGSAVCDLEKVSDALSGLWEYLGTGGRHEKELLVPVLGTGAGRLKESRETIVQEIINSFIAASSQETVCETLSIVIYPPDFYKFRIDMEDLGYFLGSRCKYWGTREGSRGGSTEAA